MKPSEVTEGYYSAETEREGDSRKAAGEEEVRKQDWKMELGRTTKVRSEWRWRAEKEGSE